MARDDDTRLGLRPTSNPLRGRAERSVRQAGSVVVRRGRAGYIRGSSRPQWLREHVPAARGWLLAAMAAREQISAVAHICRIGARHSLPVPGVAEDDRTEDWRPRKRALLRVRPDSDVLLSGPSPGVRDSRDSLRAAWCGWTRHDLGRLTRDARADVPRLPLVPTLQGG